MTTASFYINQIPNNIDEIVQSLLHHHYHLQIYFNSPLHHHLTNHHVPHSWHETVNFSNEINQLKNHHSIIIAEAYEELNEDTVEKVSFLRVLAGNYKQNAVFIDSKDILNYLQAGATTAERKKLSVKAFYYFSKYDAKLAQEIERNDALIGKRVLVIGSGGREHAIVWKIASSDKVSKVFTAPGNSGTERENSKCENVAISAENIAALVDFSVQNQIDFVFVGPEQPLVDGIVDALTAKGIPAFGPNQKAAIIEASKAWSKDFMARNNIRTARYRNFTNFAEAKAYIESLDYRVVVKASGLAAGKGVLIPTNTKEAVEGAKAILEDKTFGSAGSELVVEEFLEGEEISLLAFSDGTTAKGMPAAQDHKRVFDNDQGLNTGGMGAYAPSPLITPKQYQECLDIVQRSVTAMAAEGRPFVGVLYAGFIVTPKYGPVVLEYNCRFGDPETQVLLPLLKSDLFDIVSACVNGKLKDQTVEWNEGSACTVVCAAPGYPESYPKGATISGLQNAASLKQVKVFHAGAKFSGNNVVTNGGRVLAVSGTGNNLKQAVDVAYSGVKAISFDGIHYRTDIARRGLNKKLRIGVLGSTRGTALQPVIDAINAGQLHAEIALIISNKSSAGILERAKNHNIPSLFISAVGKSREEYDTLVANAFDAEGVDLVLMIGYMRIVSKLFCDRFAFRCLNVHPSLLPDFAGGMDLEVHAAVIAAKKKVSGCTVHFVTEQVDGGPIAVQLTCPVEENDTLETLKARVQLLEGKAFLQAIEQFKEGKFDHLAKETITYRAAGVDIDAGEELVERIKPFCKATRRTGCDAELGGFGGLFDLAQAGYNSNETILVSGTDGVGTKLKIAQATGKHRTIGIDLVAMCVNDVVVCGAEPLFFLDYYATGALNVDEAADVIEGIAEGCAQSGSALIGGETAEMAGMYAKGEYDLAGFSVGAVRRSQILPRNIIPGDVLIGLPSSGVHSNGYSLVRKCVEKSGVGWHDPVPFPSNEKTLADALLIPTKIYVKELLPYIKQERIKGLAHITGGGLLDNLPRVLPEDITAVVNFETNGWILPPVFQWLQSIANLPQNEILRTFNCGIGMILVVGKEDAEVVLRELQQLPSLYFNNTGPIIIGHLQTKEDPKQAQVTVIGNIHSE